MYLCKSVKATNLSSVGFGARKVNNTIVWFDEKWMFMRKKLLFMQKNWGAHPQPRTRQPRQNIPPIPKMDDGRTLEKSLQL